MISRRARALNSVQPSGGQVVIYVLSRDQRVRDNLALLEAQNYALEQSLPLLVVFNLFTSVTNRARQHFSFMLEGLKEVEQQLNKLHIPFYLSIGPAEENILKICSLYKAAAVFFDMSPLKGPVALRKNLAKNLDIPVYEVDTHNVVPLWIVSEKEEFAARTIRPKVNLHLKEFLVEPEQVKHHPHRFERTFQTDWDAALARVQAPELSNYNPPFKPGEHAAHAALNDFINTRLEGYGTLRNNPVHDGTSGLSPYFHYGQLAPLRAALEVQKAIKTHTGHSSIQESADSFLEELIVRNTLAQNFCYFAQSYTSLDGVKEWARNTLEAHKHDKRPIIYSLEVLEDAQTYDKAWNAAQLQMMKTGKMHGYMRMYWAKKVLEWTPDAQTAIDYCVYLNDKYHLDGYEPNGYVGILWAIAGVHDRPWFERPIFGTIRYMNFNGLKRKFDVDAYIERWTNAQDTLL